ALQRVQKLGGELAGGQVAGDRGGETGEAVLPCTEVLTRLAQDHFPDGNDQARLLGQGDELPRGDRRTIRQSPANEGLGASDPSRLQGEDGLEGHHELGVLDGVAQGRLRGQAALGPLPEHGTEQLDPTATLLLGQVHGGVGEELLGGVAVLAMDTPMLALAKTSVPATLYDLVSRAASRSPSSRAWVALLTPSQITTNSSPPRRETVSPGRTASRRRAATA